jgi:hypothetical protein
VTFSQRRETDSGTAKCFAQPLSQDALKRSYFFNLPCEQPAFVRERKDPCVHAGADVRNVFRD